MIRYQSFTWSILVSITLVLLLNACGATKRPPTPTQVPSPTPTVLYGPLFFKATPTPTTPIPKPTSACPLPDLAFGLHISASGSYTETETAAAGQAICRIRRDSCAYHAMVGNLDIGVVFKKEEDPPYNDEDIAMHPAMLLPLSRLRDLVTEEWGGGYQLRVTDAYDSLLEHDLGQVEEGKRISLHFEGRSVDLTTWPIDTTRYSRLCALAHCAGFDWVNNEGNHCHASIKAESLCLKCRD